MTRGGEREPTPSQTVGPYFALCLGAEGDHVLCADAAQGELLRLEGRVLDADRTPIEDALLELWQADAHGRYRHPLAVGLPDEGAFVGFGRAHTDARTGTFVFETLRPGSVPWLDGAPQAPHLNLVVQARGMLLPCFTRIYFSDRAEQNARDPVLQRVPAPRRPTLIAQRTSAAPLVFRFDVRMQGEDETVFFDF